MGRKAVFGAAMALIAAAILPMVIVPALSQAPGGGPGAGRGPGGRGMMGTMMYLERTWTAVSFQLDCTGTQLEQLRPTYRNTLSARDAALKQAAEAQDWEAMGKAMEDSKTRLEAKLKAVLSSAQWTKLQQLMQPRMGGMRPPGARPGGGATPGGNR